MPSTETPPRKLAIIDRSRVVDAEGKRRPVDALDIVAFIVTYARVIGRFSRLPTVGTRRACASFFAFEIALFAVVGLVRMLVVSPRVSRGAAAIGAYDRIALVCALIPAALATFACAGILRTNVDQLARDGYISRK